MQGFEYKLKENIDFLKWAINELDYEIRANDDGGVGCESFPCLKEKEKNCDLVPTLINFHLFQINSIF